jgi:chromatin remodeling complex protein RSC6
MAPRSATKRASKAEPVALESAPVEEPKVEEAPRVEPPVGTSEDILKAVAKLQRSLNKTQRAVQSIQAAQAGSDPRSQPPKPKKEPSGFAKPSRISNALSSFLGVPQDTRLARTQVTKLLTEYIKKNDLQCSENRRNIRLDDKLKELLNVPDGTVVTFFNLQKHCKNHYIPDQDGGSSE